MKGGLTQENKWTQICVKKTHNQTKTRTNRPEKGLHLTLRSHVSPFAHHSRFQGDIQTGQEKERKKTKTHVLAQPAPPDDTDWPIADISVSARAHVTA